MQPFNPTNVFVKLLLQTLYDLLPETHRIQIFHELDDVSTVATLGFERIATYDISIAEKYFVMFTESIEKSLTEVDEKAETFHDQVIFPMKVLFFIATIKFVFCMQIDALSCYYQVPGPNAEKLFLPLKVNENIIVQHLNSLLRSSINGPSKSLSLFLETYRFVLMKRILFDNEIFNYQFDHSGQLPKLQNITALITLSVLQNTINADATKSHVMSGLLAKVQQFIKTANAHNIIQCRSQSVLLNLVKFNGIDERFLLTSINTEVDEPNGIDDIENDEAIEPVQNFGCFGKYVCTKDDFNDSHSNAFGKCLEQIILQANRLTDIYVGHKNSIKLDLYANEISLLKNIFEKLD